MAKLSKNDQSIRNMLLKSGTVHQHPQSTVQRKDPKASMLAAIQARKQELHRA